MKCKIATIGMPVMRAFFILSIVAGLYFPLSQPVEAVQNVELPYTLSGNSVIHSDSDIYIEATPATLYSSGWVEVTFWTRNYEGSVDVVYGFNGVDGVKAIQSETWEDYEHELVRQVDGVAEAEFVPVKVVSKNELAKGAKQATFNQAGSLNSKLADIEYLDMFGETVKTTIAYESYDAMTGAFTYKYNGKIDQPYKETFTDWNKKTVSTTNLAYEGATKWNVAQHRSVKGYEVQKVRVWIDIPFKGTEEVSGKYNIGIKPSNLTLQQAKDQGKLWLLDPWYNASWLYRKAIVIGQTDDLGPGIYYQVKLLVGKASGATGEDFDCAGHCEDDFDDLRFTKDDGTTLLDYWIESSGVSGTSYLATVWVEAEMEDAAADTTIYVYYGNAGAAAASSGASTFELYEDFEDASHYKDNWTEVNSPTVTRDTGVYSYGVASMKVVCGATDYGTVYTPYSASDSKRIRFRARLAQTNNTVYIQNDAGATLVCALFFHTDGNIRGYNNVTNTSLQAYSANIWYKFEIRHNATNHTWSVDIDGVNKANGWNTYSNRTNQLSRFSGLGDPNTPTFYLDCIWTAKWTANEPAFSSAGAEEGFPTCALTGTITTATDADIITGGETIILTLTGDTWVAAGATFNAIRDDIIAGMDSAQSEANGWDAEYKANAAAYVADVVRTNDTVVTVTMSALATYSVTASETITVTVPAAALTLGAAVVASPTFTITKVLPLVSTQATSDITTTSALGNGTITNLNGGGNATVRGFEYDVDTGAPYAHEVHDNGSYGVGAYTKTMSSLTSGELYYNRAYATSPLGTGYGTEVTFLTLPSDPASITATVVSDSEIDLTWPAVACGAGTVVNYYVRANLGSAPTFSGAGGTTIYDSTLLAYNHTPLGSGEHWYYRMWVRITDGGLEQYSTNFAADDDTTFVAPTVTTGICTGFGTTWAVLNGNITNAGIPATVTQRGFDYGLTTGYGSSSVTTGSYGVGAYSVALTGLLPATVYHYRAKATNGAWGYGADATFATQGSPTPYVYYNTGDDAYGTTLVASENWTYQTFTTGTTAFTVSAVKLLLGRVGNPGSVTMSLRRTAGGVPTGADLCSVSTNGDLFSAAYTWQPFDVTTVCSLEPSTMYAIVLRATDGDGSNYVRWRWDAGGGLANGNAGHSNNNGVSWTTDAPADFLFEIWGTPAMEVQDVKVFQSYKDTGDWLITVRYINLYPPYYDTYDVRKYFDIQLVDSTGALKAQSAMTAWGNRVGNIYLSPTTVSALTYGGDYRIRLYGKFTGNPYTEYAIQSADWQGDDLTNLDSWVITSASVIGAYYEETLTTYIAERGEVLNAQGGAIFSTGINGLGSIRPLIFQIYTGPIQYDPQTSTQTNRIAWSAWQVNWGPDGVVMLTRVGNLFGVDGNIIATWFTIIAVIVLAVVGFSPGHTTAANILSIPILFAGLVLGFDWIYIAVLGIMASFLFVKNQWIDK